MPKPAGKRKQKDAKVPDSDVLIAFQKGKPANGHSLVCTKDKRGAVILHSLIAGVSTLVCRKDLIDGRQLLRINLDFPDPRLIMMVGGYATKPGELFDTNLNQILYTHLQDTWNENRRRRIVESGSLL
jgi:hypothetical protein